MSKSRMSNPRDTWATPSPFIDWVKRVVLAKHGHDHFTLDTCADYGNAVCMAHYNEEANGLLLPWGSRVAWCNPGFSNVAPWIEKAIQAAQYKGAFVCLLTHAQHSTAWFRTAQEGAAECWLINPRINFVAPQGIKQSSNNRDSLLWVFTPEKQGNCEFIYPAKWRHQ